MRFLALFGLDDIIYMINNVLRGLFGFLCEIIYPGIASLYDLFINLGKQVYIDKFTVIYNKISLIIGIFMVFRVTFWLIESLINPDTMSDKEKNPGKIIQKVLVSVVLLATTPTIFKYAFKIQNVILDTNLIENIMSIDKKEDATETGRFLSAELFSNFYTPTKIEQADGSLKPFSSDCTKLYIDGPYSHYENLKEHGKLDDLNNYCLTKTINNEKTGEFEINFNGLFAVGVGGFVFWMILMYCISLGTRYVQLIYLQVIAPIPIMCYLAPGKDNMFSKWIKQCTTTYLDLFIRIIIINFVMLLCNMILKNDGTFVFNSSNDNWLIEVFLVLGLLTFAKKAPELIQELLPKSVTKASGDFGLSLKKRSESMLGGKFMYSTLKRAPGYATGGVVGAATGGVIRAAGAKGVGGKFRGAIAGAASGFVTGSKKGSLIKNIGEVRKNQAAQNSKLQQWRIAAGKDENAPDTLADSMARRADAFKKAIGFETKAAELKRDTEFANQAAGSYKNIIDFGSGKALEKNKQLKAFGINKGITELDAIQKSAAAEYQSATVENLMTTDEGRLKLKNIAWELNKSKFDSERELLIDNLVKQKGYTKEEATKKTEAYLEKNFKDRYNAKDESERVKDAQMVIEYLRDKSIKATQTFEDNKKQAGFIHLVEEYANGKDQNIINEFKVMNDFLKSHPEIANEFGIEQFDAKEMNELRKQAESPENIDAQKKFKELFDSFDKFKTLKSIYAAKNASEEALRDKANDQYSGK